MDIAIVTGHSRGIGEAVAMQLLDRDIRVLGIARHENPGLAKRYGRRLEQFSLDLADSGALATWLAGDALNRCVDGAESAILVNNAGVLQPIGPLELQEVEQVSRAVAVNVAAAFMLAAAFVKATAPAKERRILHVSSAAGHKAYAGWSIYCATKAALDHHARCVALDRTPGLRIASIAPGVVDTEMQAEIRASTDERFPERPRFIAMHRDKAIPSPAAAAAKIVRYLLSDVFGSAPVFDVREEGSFPLPSSRP